MWCGSRPVLELSRAWGFSESLERVAIDQDDRSGMKCVVMNEKLPSQDWQSTRVFEVANGAKGSWVSKVGMMQLGYKRSFKSRTVEKSGLLDDQVAGGGIPQHCSSLMLLNL